MKKGKGGLIQPPCKKNICGPCHLCKKPKVASSWIHLATSKNTQLNVYLQQQFPDLASDACICHACRHKYVKKMKNPDYTPEKTRIKKRGICFLSSFGLCNSSSVVDSSFSLDQFRACFGITDCSEIPDSIPLCSTHKARKRNWNTNAKCAACAIFLPSFSRKYSCVNLDIEQIYQHLQLSGDEAIISKSSYLCYTCYCVAKREVVPKISLHDVEINLQLSEEESCHVNIALHYTFMEILKMCHSDEAFLLADIFDFFLASLNTECNKDSSGNGLCFDQCRSACSSRWLLSKVLDKFCDLLEVHKMARKQSILLIYKNLDLGKALHLSCWRIRQEKKRREQTSSGQSTVFEFDHPRDIGAMAQNVLPQINEKLRDQSKCITEHYTKNPCEIASFDFDSLMSMIDPIIWNAVSVLTANSDELKYFHSSELIWDQKKVMFPTYSTLHGRQRYNRRVILIMCMQFVYNETNNFPFHIATANIIKRLSHSSKLIKLFNQSGFCTSEDTLDRYLEHIRQLRQQSGLLSTLDSSSFTVVTIDNIDVLASHAAITSKGSGRSWHGTSVMAQQPMPLSEKLSSVGELLKNDAQAEVPAFQLIPIYGDGRCFYRCIAAYSKNNLLFCERNEVGIPVDNEYFELEQQIADKVRHCVCSHLEKYTTSLETLPEAIKHIYLESSNMRFYSSFSEKIRDNRKPGTYAGNLEICSVVCLLRMEIRIYQSTVQGLKLVAKYPHGKISDYHICLLYCPGKNDLTGHFDLLYINGCRPNVDSLNLDDHGNEPEFVFSNWHAAIHDSNTQTKPDFMQLISLSVSETGESNEHESVLHAVDSASLSSSLDCASSGTISQYENASVPKQEKSVIHKPSVRRLFQDSNLSVPEKSHFVSPLFKTFIGQQLTLKSFFPSDEEKVSERKLKQDVFMHVIERYVSVLKLTEHCVPGMKCNMMLHSRPHCEKSKFSYLHIINEKADCARTLKSVVGLLYDLFQVSKSINHLVVAGDGATIKILLDVKREYGNMLDWIVPYLGDWHILKNFQEVLMKIFWDAGLKDIAKTTHKGNTLINLKSCQNFKRTHRFLLQVYEAIYIYQFKCFLDFRNGKPETECSADNEFLLRTVQSVVDEVHIKGDLCDYTGMEEFVAKVHLKLHEFLPALLEEFSEFCDNKAEKYETFKFWNRFLKEDCFSYIQLWIAIRTGDWNMRQVALKKMAPLFHAFDRQNYSKLIPIHLSHMHGLPDYILDHFKNGGFVSSIRGVNFSSLGFDEAHEMLINKDCKTTLSRGLPKNMDQITGTIEFQAKLVDNFEQQTSFHSSIRHLQRDFSPAVIKAELENVKTYFSRVTESVIFHDEQQPILMHAFEGKPASKVQQKSLLNYRDVGMSSYDSYVRSCILKQSSVAKPVIRKKRLQTFAKEKITKRAINYLEKEKKLITLCYKRTIAFSEEHNQPIHELLQFIETPRAICTPSGLPCKGTKYVMYGLLAKRYAETCSPVKDAYVFPSGTCLVAEGMNIIYSNPLPGLKTFLEYAHMIVSRWVAPFFKRKYREIRILFDQVCSQGISPKAFERQRRDASTDDEVEVYSQIVDETPLPTSWSKFLKIRQNKQKLCQYLSCKFLEIVPSSLQSTDQLFVTSGGFIENESAPEMTGMCVSMNGTFPHAIIHNHEESDTQIWLHVKETVCSTVHIYSLDRDIGMIGLPFNFVNKTVVIQFKASSTEDKFLDLDVLRSALSNDPDLAPLMTQGCDLYKIMQVLYIVSGCDFVSFFARFGKSTFLKVFFQFSDFISGNSSPETCGQLSFTDVDNNHELGLLSFFRLVGSVYFQANRASLHQHASNPVELFNSIGASTALEHHSKFLSVIRKASWQGVYEDSLLPSDSALSFHWLRSCWVAQVWGSATQPVFNYPDLNLYGWHCDEDSSQVHIVWDSPENMDKIRKNVLHLTRGCSCVKNKCVTQQCKCRGKNAACGPGCSCRNCGNLPVSS